MDPSAPFTGSSTRDVVIVFGDQSARQQASEFFYHLSHRTERGSSYQCFWWHFNELLTHSFLAEAVEKSVKASYVVVAGDANSFPPEIQLWLHRWSERCDGKQILVGLLGVGTDHLVEKSRLYAALLDTAKHYALQFRVFPFVVQPGAIESPEHLNRRARSITPLLQRFIDTPVPPPSSKWD